MLLYHPLALWNINGEMTNLPYSKVLFVSCEIFRHYGRTFKINYQTYFAITTWQFFNFIMKHSQVLWSVQKNVLQISKKNAIFRTNLFVCMKLLQKVTPLGKYFSSITISSCSINSIIQTIILLFRSFPSTYLS